MRILSGDDTGLIKSINLEEKKIEQTYGEQKLNLNINQISVINEVYQSKFLYMINLIDH